MMRKTNVLTTPLRVMEWEQGRELYFVEDKLYEQFKKLLEFKIPDQVICNDERGKLPAEDQDEEWSRCPACGRVYEVGEFNICYECDDILSDEWQAQQFRQMALEWQQEKEGKNIP